jgi:formylglycine-generating enzyme required for sulfatase activity
MAKKTQIIRSAMFLLAVLVSASAITFARAGTHSQVLASEVVSVPAGPFMMGCASDLGCDYDTHPIHGVYLDAYYIDKTEVTKSQYTACVAAGACPAPLPLESDSRFDDHTQSADDNYPVTGVDWPRAKAYCSWVGKRLPTEAEWEKAARGTDLRMYPWGNEPPTCERANLGGCAGGTLPVNSHPDSVSPYGASDMAGNVSEWVNDIYSKEYYEDSPYFNPPGPDGPEYDEHLVRGGSWDDSQGGIVTFVRLDGSEIYHLERIGFRCARSAGPGGTPTPTPIPSPTPTPLPVPASKTIGLEGGLVWQAYQRHLTLLNVPPGAVTDPTTITLHYDQMPTQQRDLEGLDHFFSIGLTGSTPISSFQVPVQVILGYPGYGPIISGSLGFYRLDASSWVTEGITLTQLTSEDVLAQIDRAGTYGLLGSTNRYYLPLLLHQA